MFDFTWEENGEQKTVRERIAFLVDMRFGEGNSKKSERKKMNPMNPQTAVNETIKYLKEKVAILPDQLAISATYTDEPYQRFTAEWQDWSFAEAGFAILAMGYWQERNGDLVPDSNICLNLQDGKITGGTIHHSFGKFPLDRESLELVAEMYQRHIARRLEQQ